jgi:hypothetical protein
MHGRHGSRVPKSAVHRSKPGSAGERTTARQKRVIEAMNPIDTRDVRVRFPIEAGGILAFARAIGDSNPMYYQSMTQEAEVVAPPTYVEASAHFDPAFERRPLLASAANTAEAANSPTPARPPVMHAEQLYRYSRPIRSGEVLLRRSRAGNSWVKPRRSGGQLRFSETIYEYTEFTGDLVVEARTVAVELLSR